MTISQPCAFLVEFFWPLVHPCATSCCQEPHHSKTAGHQLTCTADSASVFGFNRQFGSVIKKLVLNLYHPIDSPENHRIRFWFFYFGFNRINRNNLPAALLLVATCSSHPLSCSARAVRWRRHHALLVLGRLPLPNRALLVLGLSASAVATCWARVLVLRPEQGQVRVSELLCWLLGN